MIKRLLGHLDYSIFAEASLIIFVAIFILVSIYTLLRQRTETSRQAQIVLDEYEVAE